MILSKTPFIGDSFYYHLLLGPPDHAEFWSGKGIGKVTTNFKNLPVSFFNVHLLSRRARDANNWEDKNSLDRLIELFEVFTQVVEQTESDAFVLVGDFNMNIHNQEYRFFRNLTSLPGGLFQEDDILACTFCLENTFNNHEEGQLDYIWISPRLELKDYWVDFKKLVKVKDEVMNLADHYGVIADIGVNQTNKKYDVSNIKDKMKTEINWLYKRVERAVIDFKMYKGVEEKFCRKCRLEDALEHLEYYRNVLEDKIFLNEQEELIKMRLESYLLLFE